MSDDACQSTIIISLIIQNLKLSILIFELIIDYVNSRILVIKHNIKID